MSTDLSIGEHEIEIDGRRASWLRKYGSNPECCRACHQTTSWNDIKGVGWYKHH